MTTLEKTTINGVDCYGRIAFGKAVEVIFRDLDDSVIVTSRVSNWADFINYLNDRGYVPFAELVAEA